MKPKNLIRISLFAVILALAIFTHFFGNLWNLVTGRGYFIPEESNMFTFNVTEWNDGSGEWWLYGEDKKSCYALNTEPDYTPKYFRMEKGKEGEGFDKFDFRTWKNEK